MTLRIGYLTSQYPAPSHTFIAREVAELRRRGVEVHTFSVRPAGTTVYGSQLDLSTYYLLPIRPILYGRAIAGALWRDPKSFLSTMLLALRHRVPGLKALFLSGAYFAEAMVLAAELRRRQIFHVHNHFANPSATVSLLATRYLGLKWSLTLHAHSETDYPAGNLLGAKLEQCDFAACISHFGRAQAYRHVGPEHWHKLFISRCGLDLQALPEAPEREPREAKRIICVARLAPEKGHAGLLQAFCALSSGSHELVFVGDGPERERLEAEAKALGIANRVIFKGALPEAETLREIAASDVLVLASFMEGIPVALMEAMALRVPVVAPNLAGIPELVTNGYNGELFAPADWSGLASAIDRVLASSNLRQQYAKAGYETIEGRHDIKKAIIPLLVNLQNSYLQSRQ